MPFSGRKILLLQGPMGPFFWFLRRDMKRLGANVTKINFNCGDLLFYPFKCLLFRGQFGAWEGFLRRIIKERGIEQIYLFGDCRPHHRVAVRVAKTLGLQVVVFEEGYLRPNYITVEKGGVNGFSSLCLNPLYYLDRRQKGERASKRFAHPFARMAFFATFYYLAGWFGRPLFAHYRHHRPFSPWQETVVWLRSAWRKQLHWRWSKKVEKLLQGAWSKRYFLVPLQVHNDSQLSCHSTYDLPGFLSAVFASFACHAPAEMRLVIKHHPMDRGYSDHTATIDRLITEYGLQGRVVYTWDTHLPTALDHTRGVVVVNSTVGLQALHHGAPTKTFGRAIYDMPGLTCQKPLDEFWHEPSEVNPVLYENFRSHLLHTTQLNGSFSYPLTPDLFHDLRRILQGEPSGLQEQTASSLKKLQPDAVNAESGNRLASFPAQAV